MVCQDMLFTNDLQLKFSRLHEKVINVTFTVKNNGTVDGTEVRFTDLVL